VSDVDGGGLSIGRQMLRGGRMARYGRCGILHAIYAVLLYSRPSPYRRYKQAGNLSAMTSEDKEEQRTRYNNMEQHLQDALYSITCYNTAASYSCQYKLTASPVEWKQRAREQEASKKQAST
jgi:hypothetical protein